MRRFSFSFQHTNTRLSTETKQSRRFMNRRRSEHTLCATHTHAFPPFLRGAGSQLINNMTDRWAPAVDDDNNNRNIHNNAMS